ncbi:MAG: SpoIIE family protein phosphatase [Flavobacteriales bacterium]|nr:SpoIIE family protein phosphatase [Flavobacteriales bacterium]
MSTRLTLLLTILAFCTLEVQAQSYFFKNYTSKDGLPQSDGKCVFSASDGYLWIGTQNGVARFNGQLFEHYGRDEGIGNVIVNCISEDSDRHILIGTVAGLYAVNNSRSFPKELNNFCILEILPVGNDLYIRAKDKGTFLLVNNKLTRIDQDESLIKDMLCFEDEVYFLRGKHIEKKSGTVLKEFSVDGRKMAVTSKGTFWVLHNKGVVELKEAGEQKFSLTDLGGFRLLHELFIDQFDQVWLASEREGLVKLSSKDYHINIFQSEQGLLNQSIHGLAEDAQGNLWIGGRFGVTVFYWNTPFQYYKSELPKEFVLGLEEDHDYNLWMPTFGGGVYVKNKDGQFHKVEEVSASGVNRFFDVIEDHQHRIWLSTANAGVMMYDQGEITLYNEANGFKDIRCFSLMEDHQNNIWIGTQAVGAVRFNGDKFEYFNASMPGGSDQVMHVFQDSDHRIWMASLDSGVLFIDAQQQIQRLQHEQLKTGFFRQISQDDFGWLWFGSGGEGAFRYHPKTDQIQVFNEATGLNSNVVYLLFKDEQGFIWIGSEKGLNKISFTKDGEVDQIRQYSRTDGFIDMEANINGATQDHLGNIWFSSTQGVVKYMPKADTFQQQLPMISLKEVKLDYQSIDYSLFAEKHQGGSLPNQLVFDHEENHITIYFDGIHFKKPDEVVFRYRLDGAEENWAPVTSKRDVVYPNLSPGEYTFKLQASVNGLNWSEEVELQLTIRPPFWQEAWFILVCIIVAALGTGIVFKWRMRSLEKSKKELEIAVVQRTVQIERQKDHIEEQNLDIMASIACAERIQFAMLPTNEKVRKLWNQNFIICKPRDIVSGDFYWIDEVDGKRIIVAADCTGHGVPGAFVSLIGNNHLDDIILNNRILSPDKILSELHLRIIKSLKQDEIESQFGMDINITVTDQEKILFAAAYNPLVYIDQSNQIVKVKGDRVALGGSFHMEAIDFTLHEIPVKDVKRFYQFSDGIIDQFGGTKGKKMMLKRLNEMILNSGHLSMSLQKEFILEEFRKWMKDEGQIDDILLIGCGLND